MLEKWNPFKSKAGKGLKKTKGIISHDPAFEQLYEQAIEVTQTPPSGKRPARFYNLLQFLKQIPPEAGDYAECGCFRGLSSFLLLSTLREEKGLSYRGRGFHIFDSFQGLAAPSVHDFYDDVKSHEKIAAPAGKFAADIRVVKEALRDFPDVEYHPGWIPQSLEGIPEKKYKFIHIDLDFYEPIKGALEYFYPRLTENGMILFDDYGSPKWPGAKKAVDDYCRSRSISPLKLSTGQAVIWK